MLISIIGGREVSKKSLESAYKVGEAIAKNSDYLVCGGYSGIMEKAAKGCKDAGGTTIGILYKDSKEGMNAYIDIPIVTGIGIARNAIIVQTADIVIAFEGSYGTLSELGFGLAWNKPVIGIGTWDIKGIKKTKNTQEAIELYKNIRETM